MSELRAICPQEHKFTGEKRDAVQPLLNLKNISTRVDVSVTSNQNHKPECTV